MRPLPILAAALLALAGCGDGRQTPGFVIGADGQPRYTNAANIRAETERTIERALDRELAPQGWRAKTAIAAEPRYDGDREAWLWPATTVRVDLVGPASTPPPLEAATVRDAVADYFAERMAQRGERMEVVVGTAAAEPAVVAQPGAPASATPPAAPVAEPAPAAASGWPQRYVVQPGDTLARISAVFYGSTKHWRRLVEANPDLQPEALRVGQELVIPAPE